eukprot:tig00000293_g23899.t1
MGWVDGLLTKVFGPKSAQPPPSFNLAAAISTTIERKNNELILKNDGKLPWADVAAGALGSTLTGIDRTGAAGVKVGQAVAAVPELAMKGWHYAKIAAGVAAVLLAIWLAWQLRGAYQGARLQSAQLDYFLKAR